jgi:hypothetical protein
MSRFKQGKFRPKNPDKYVGDVSNVVYRSSWEHRFMLYLDFNPAVLKWQSEELAIPYFFELDNKMHRYYPDFCAQIKSSDGSVNNFMIEIKPKKDTEIKQPKKMTEKAKRSLAYQAITVAKNEAKWDAARKYCEARNMKFMVMTEDQLFG